MAKRKSGIRIVRADGNGEPRLILFIHGKHVKLAEKAVATLACLHDNFGHVVAYRMLARQIGLRGPVSAQNHSIRQYVLVLKRLLAKHKAKCALTVARNVGYALCPRASDG